MSVLIKGGRIVTAADDYVGDVYVEDETVTLIGTSLDVEADRVIDASGKYVLPGGVDPHTHLDMPFGGTVTIDDVEFPATIDNRVRGWIMLLAARKKWIKRIGYVGGGAGRHARPITLWASNLNRSDPDA